MGYRWYDEQVNDPLFSFGYSLSYTTFAYSNLSVAGTVTPYADTTVTLTLASMAGPAGAEVVQLYMRPPPASAAGSPPQALVALVKVALPPRDVATVAFNLTACDVCVWDVTTGGWKLVPGESGIAVGSGSRYIRLLGSVRVDAGHSHSQPPLGSTA
jgi:beta-glucosidase